MGILDRLRRLDDRVGLSGAPARWQVGDADPPRWARRAATHRFATALTFAVLAAVVSAALWTLGDYAYTWSNLAARTAFLAPMMFLASALATASVADRVDLVERLRRAERAQRGPETTRRERVEDR